MRRLAPEPWTEAPSGLPARPALFRTEPVDGLVGQLSFDYELDGQVGVAILYPMLNPANNALATLEMRAVEDAVEELAAGDTVAARRAAELAVAVRQARWAKLNTTGRSIEVSKEVVQGTAKYVEARSVDRVARWCRSVADLFPDAWNAWDSLGEGLVAAGRVDEAAAAYRRSVALDGYNDNARRELRLLALER